MNAPELPIPRFWWITCVAAAAVLAVVVGPAAFAAEHFVSPAGTPAGDGTRERPWDLQTALDQPPAVRPGDTIWLFGGTYTGAFVSSLRGSELAPIVVRAQPGERVTIDRNGSDAKVRPALTVNGSRVWYWGIEVTNSGTDRGGASAFTGAVRPWRGDGVDVYGPDNKFINMVFHDNGAGIWDKSDGTEIYGCLFYFNGNNRFEHGLYVGNSRGTKTISDCVVFDNAGFGIHAFSGSDASAQTGLTIERNAVFNNGSLLAEDQPSTNVIVGGVRGVPARRIRVAENLVYSPPRCPNGKSQGILLGYDDAENSGLQLVGNVVVGFVPLRVYWWSDVVCRGNTVVTSGNAVDLKLPTGTSVASYVWDENTYVSTRPSGVGLSVDGWQGVGIRAWRAETGLDRDSVERTDARALARRADVFVRENAYERGRGNVFVYNPALETAVDVDLSGVLSAGDRFEVVDAENYYGAPVVSGVYGGGRVRLPLRLSAIAAPRGRVERVPAHTAPELAAFVVRRR
jgi:hypothetical protein